MATFELPEDVVERLREEAALLDMTFDEHLAEIMQRFVAPAENLKPGAMARGVGRLETFLNSVPAVKVLSTSDPTDPYWWVKLDIDLKAPLAWQVVQHLAYVLNYLSIHEPLPTVFKPVSPPPYLNGGPGEFLSWVVEATIPFLDAGIIADYLEQRLPSPIGDEEQWRARDDE